MKTAIILVTYNGWAMTENCLNDMSPLLQRDDFVVAIADNCSTDDTVKNLQEKFPQVHVYRQTKNLGFGAANNAAINGLIQEGIQFDTICLLNNDTRFDSTAICNLQIAFETATKTFGESIVVPTTLNADGSRQNNFFAGLAFEGIGGIRFLKNAFKGEAAAAKVLEGVPQKTSVDTLLQTHWASAVCWMLSAKLWQKTKGFDEHIFMYYEDADLALRAKANGASFYITSKSVITHLGGGSASNSLSRALQHDRSQQYVFKKHFGIKGYLLSKVFRVLRSSVRVVLGFKKPGYAKHHLALIKEALFS